MAFRPGNHDRAWNDPPMFSFQQAATEGGKEENSTSLTNSRKTLLNKRVAFPLSSTAVQQTSPPTANMPPKSLEPLVVIPPVPVSQPDGDASSVEPNKTMEQFTKVKNTLENCVASFLEPDKQADFLKRLQILFSSWRDGKFNQDICGRIMTLCDHLEERNFSKAESVQVSLAVDYIAECASWIVVLKNIISEMKCKVNV